MEANKTCVNCGNYNRFGHQNICEKVRTFVCSNCKSAHQSYSMRVKSVSMSNWTMDEVDALREPNGGGNAVAARVWLGRWDESQMRKPTKDDPLDYYKQFINRVYNDKAFYDEDGFNAVAASSPTAKSSARAATAAPVSNLLDFDTPAQKKSTSGGFDAFETSSSSPGNDGWGNFAAAPAPVSSNDGFGAFASAPAPTASANNGFADFSAAPAPAPAGNDGFGAFASAPPAPISNSNSFDPFASTGGNVLTPNTPSAPFDPFAPAPTSTNQSQNPSANIMNQFNAAPAPKDFSAFDGLSAPSLAYGTPQRNHNGNGYGQARGPAGMGMGMQGRGQQMHMGMGMQQQHGGFQQQQHFQQQQQPMMGGYAGMHISSHFSPNGVAAGGNSGTRSNGRDPFAGLGLPQK
ncbi:Arf GTPase activating protein [Phytophthora cactorum]|nr:Arf GTPase activating protein [Phytophthora cactorum]